MPMKTLPRTRGFTLVELLVVILILGVLLGRLMPGMANVWHIARTSQCARHLSAIGKAYNLYRNDEVLGTKEEFDTQNWPIAILPYLSNEADILLCPEGDSFLPSASLQAQYELKTYWCGDNYKTMWYTPIVEGTFILKLSNTQYLDARSKGYLTRGGAVDAHNLRTKFDCTYHPDGDPTYWLCIEDGGNFSPDFDFCDVMIKVDEQEDGSVKLTIASAIWTANKNSLVLKKDGSMVLEFPTGGFTGLTITLKAHGSATSYAMNEAVVDPSAGSGKILALDYYQYLVNPMDNDSTDVDWTDPDVDPEGDDVPNFARHQGCVNILFTDNSVSAHEPKEIDPAEPTIERQFWDP